MTQDAGLPRPGARCRSRRAEAGDIVAIAGLDTTTVADTLCEPAVETPIPAQPIDPPTIAMTFSVNDWPLAGQEGDKVTAASSADRLLREAEGNVAIRGRAETEEKDAFEVAGRGELQLGVLIETMRREGFELSIGRPRVLFQTDPRPASGSSRSRRSSIDVDEEYSGVVVEKMAQRRGELRGHAPVRRRQDAASSSTRPRAALIGYHGEFLTDTRGTGVMNRAVPWLRAVQGRDRRPAHTAC